MSNGTDPTSMGYTYDSSTGLYTDGNGNYVDSSGNSVDANGNPLVQSDATTQALNQAGDTGSALSNLVSTGTNAYNQATVLTKGSGSSGSAAYQNPSSGTSTYVPTPAPAPVASSSSSSITTMIAAFLPKTPMGWATVAIVTGAVVYFAFFDKKPMYPFAGKHAKKKAGRKIRRVKRRH